jgi:hypothetical protein
LAQRLAVIAVATAVVAVVVPGHRSVALGAGVMAALALLLIEMGVATHRLARGRDDTWDRVRRVEAVRPERPADLERIERRFGWGQYSTGDFNYRVRPTLRRLAAHRLRETRRIDVDDPSARDVVTPDLWDYVIAKQPPDGERVLTTRDIAGMVDELESL